MKKLASLATLLLSTSLLAASADPRDYEIGSITVTETTSSHKSLSILSIDEGNTTSGSGGGETREERKPIDLERVGKVIQLSRDMVALGEVAYTLVQKGKPKNTTEYAAISVVPRDPETKEFVSPFDLEGFSLPLERSFRTSIKNANGKEVVRFDYQIIYSYGGSYNGSGNYLTGVMIVPKNIETSWGWEFDASMKLHSMMNHGTVDNHIAGAMVTIKYNVSGWTKSVERNDTIHVTGTGHLRSYGVR